MMLVRNVYAHQLSRQFGISEPTCIAFLAEAKTHMPEAYLSILNCRARIMYQPVGERGSVEVYLMERLRHGYVRIASDALTPWELIPQGSITKPGAADRATRLFKAEIVPDQALAKSLHQHLRGFYRKYRIST